MACTDYPLRLDPLLSRVEKAARYTGGEWNSVRKPWQSVDLHLLLAYPDIYEIGSCHLGLQILYELVNRRDDTLAERVYAPWVDMESALRADALPLFSLESRRPVASFDVVGFTLPYELTFTNVLNMLALSGLPVMSADRTDADPLIIAGGSVAFNPEPMAEVFDLFVIGDGEEAIHQLLDALRDSGWRPSRSDPRYRRQREIFLRHSAKLPGIYVPSLYELDQTTRRVVPRIQEAPRRVTKCFVPALPFAPVRPIVPFLAPVHDRAMVEIMRGCARGCRFCNAGILYRSVRERPPSEIIALATQVLANTGYQELGLVSLSSADHGAIEEVVTALAHRFPDVNLSLPSLRVDSFSVRLVEAIHRRKTGFTFAPEAGSQRMREVINKHVNEDDVLRAADAAFSHGYSLIKLYFMIGLPGETMADVASIGQLAQKILAAGRRHQGARARVNVSVNTFVPKAHTPFQWVAQESDEILRAKQRILSEHLARMKFSWSDNQVSWLEGALARGDRRLGAVIHNAWHNGARFDAWRDHFRISLWTDASSSAGCDLAAYTQQRPLDTAFAWDHIDTGVTKAYLRAEYQRALASKFTPDCHVHDQCSACGHSKLDPKCKEAARRVKMAAHV